MWHAVFNVSALWSIGVVERAVGVAYYIQQSALLFLLSPLVRGAGLRAAPALGPWAASLLPWAATRVPASLPSAFARPSAAQPAVTPVAARARALVRPALVQAMAAERLTASLAGPPYSPSPAQICLLLYHLMIYVGKREEYHHVLAVGYSCVIFGWVLGLTWGLPTTGGGPA